MRGEKGKAHLAMILIILFTFTGAAANAEEDDTRTPPEAVAPAREGNRLPCSYCDEDQWQFFFIPYLWIPGMNLDFTLGGHTVGINEGWWNMAAKLFTDAIGAMGRFEAWKGRWGFYLDSYFVYLQGSETDGAGQTMTVGPPQQPRTLELSGGLNYIVRAGKVDFGMRYLLGTLPLSAEKPLPMLSFEALGGGRFLWYNQDVRLGLNAVISGGVVNPAGEKTFTTGYKRELVEPFVGARIGCWLTEKTVFLFRGTLGGFGFVADNNSDSDLELTFGYRVHRDIYAHFGYRALYEQADPGQLSISGWIHGPVLGASITF
jgi:hypothetical protein